MDKLKITQKLANAIDYYYAVHGEFWKHHLLADAVELERYIGKIEFATEIKTFTENGGLDLILQALVIGYEVEETPEEKIREYYKDQIKRAGSRDGTDHVSPAAIRHVLNLLNIKIVGVNHE